MQRNPWEVKIPALKELVSYLLVQLGPTPSEVKEKSLIETYEELDTRMYISTKCFWRRGSYLVWSKRRMGTIGVDNELTKNKM